MSSDDDYWKERYKDKWSESKKREDKIKEIIEEETGRKLNEIGLGAGSEDYLSGSAESRGHERGGADYEVEGTNIHLEITGPLVTYVDVNAPLWVRPDKVKNAIDHPEREKWVIHHLMKDNTIRVINLSQDFLKRYTSNEFKIVRPYIRGTYETYVEIPADDECVKPFSALLDRLRIQ